LVLSLPVAAYAVGGLTGEPSLATAGSVLVLIGLVGSLTGFMGSDTTGAGAYVGPAMIVALSLDLALRCLALRRAAGLGPAAGTLGLGGGAGLASLGLFQILAVRFAADARRIDLHAATTPEEPAGDRDTVSDWSTRE